MLLTEKAPKGTYLHKVTVMNRGTLQEVRSYHYKAKTIWLPYYWYLMVKESLTKGLNIRIHYTYKGAKIEASPDDACGTAEANFRDIEAVAINKDELN